jgi:hypothetical protein
MGRLQLRRKESHAVLDALFGRCPALGVDEGARVQTDKGALTNQPRDDTVGHAQVVQLLAGDDAMLGN